MEWRGEGGEGEGGDDERQGEGVAPYAGQEVKEGDEGTPTRCRGRVDRGGRERLHTIVSQMFAVMNSEMPEPSP